MPRNIITINHVILLSSSILSCIAVMSFTQGNTKTKVNIRSDGATKIAYGWQKC